MSPVPTYSAAEESVVAEIPAGTPTLSSLEGLAAPGGATDFKVYVVVTTGNEKGSNVVRITRPG